MVGPEHEIHLSIGVPPAGRFVLTPGSVRIWQEFVGYFTISTTKRSVFGADGSANPKQSRRNAYSTIYSFGAASHSYRRSGLGR
jgi:hypothetical protein